MRWVSPLLSVALLLTGCESEETAPAEPIESDRRFLSADEAPPWDGLLVHPDSQVVRGAATPWDWAQISDAGSTLRVGWVGGNEGCFGLDRVLVVYRPEFLVVTLYEGSERSFLRAPGPSACTLEGLSKVTSVPLSEALNGRPILDGTCLVSRAGGCRGEESIQIPSPQDT